MKRSELAHILRSACRITGDPDILVIGSQSILGKFSHVALPDEAWLSVEADIAFFDDPDESKADEVDGAIGEARRSMMHSVFTARASAPKGTPSGGRFRARRGKPRDLGLDSEGG